MVSQSGCVKRKLTSPGRRAWSAGAFSFGVFSRVIGRSLWLLISLWLILGTAAAQTGESAQANAGEKLVAEANELFGRGTKDSLELAVRKLLEAASQYHAKSDTAHEAGALSNVGRTYLILGELQKSLDYYKQTLELCRASGDQRTEAITLNSIGAVYDTIGDKQQAVDYFNQALLRYHNVHDGRNEAATLNNIGSLYRGLGDTEKAFEYLNQALPLARTSNDSGRQAAVLNGIGGIYSASGDKQQALEYYSQALPLCEALRDARCEGTTLNNIGSVHSALGDQLKAISDYNRALPFLRASRNGVSQAAALNGIGLAYVRLGDSQKALSFYDQSLQLCRTIKQRNGEATTLYNIANLERDRGNLDAALTNVEAALAIVETLRARISSQELRAAFFATVQNYYQFYVDLLMRLHERQPSAGFVGKALEVSEHGRARSLLETLAEANADIRQGVDPVLLERERRCQQRLNARAEEQMKLLGRTHTNEQADTIDKDVEGLATELRQVETQIRLKSPGYAALTQPQPLTLKQIQGLLDRDTLLLEYSLGKDKSYLWAVTPDSITGYGLPNSKEIEDAAREVYTLLTDAAKWSESANNRGLGLDKPGPTTSRTPAEPEAVARLARMILAPVASQLGKKRLVVVADGALQYIPFGALSLESGVESLESKDRARQTTGAIPATTDSKRQAPDSRVPTPDFGVPLIVEHEIVSLPSASTLAVLRQEVNDRKPAPKTVAVVADPVFGSNDERIAKTIKGSSADKSSTGQALAGEGEVPFGFKRSAEESGVRGRSLPRLPGTRAEATQILSLVPKSLGKESLDFAASRQTVTAGELSQYRYVHFATHGFLNSLHPELSGLVLSMFDDKGNPQDGFLRAHEIFNLKLPAELVVLSACQTGLGKEVKGEGLVSLTRGFMYAGAPRVVVSLWSVNDRATAQLMARFYRGMLQEKLRPAAALRAAQVSLMKESSWEAPFYWAAFILQGEWQ